MHSRMSIVTIKSNDGQFINSYSDAPIQTEESTTFSLTFVPLFLSVIFCAKGTSFTFLVYPIFYNAQF